MVLLALVFYLLITTVHRSRFNPISFLASTLSMVNGMVLPLLGLVILLDLLTWFFWRKKARLAVE